MKVSPLDSGGTSPGISPGSGAIGNLRTLNELSVSSIPDTDFRTLNDASWRTWNDYSAGESFLRHAKGKPASLEGMDWFRQGSSDSPRNATKDSPPHLPATAENEELDDLDLGVSASLADADLRAYNEMSWRTWNELSHSSELMKSPFMRTTAREPPKRAGLDSLDWQWTLGEHETSSPKSPELKIAEDGACSTVSDNEMRAFNELSWRTWNEMSYSVDMVSMQNFGRPAVVQAQARPGLDAMEWNRNDNEEPKQIDRKIVDQASAAPDNILPGQKSPPPGMDGEPLRVEVGEGVRPQQTKFPSPGSIGHPELCTRPCLYFAAGTCANKENCDFCHLSHPRRPARLDKRHRERFDKLSEKERIAVVLPILLEKAQGAGLPQNHVQPVLDKLKNQCADVPEQAENIRVSKSLLQALAAMNLRSLLIMLDEAPVMGAPVAGMNFT